VRVKEKIEVRLNLPPMLLRQAKILAVKTDRERKEVLEALICDLLSEYFEKNPV
jgi:hypothetical protein